MRAWFTMMFGGIAIRITSMPSFTKAQDENSKAVGVLASSQ